MKRFSWLYILLMLVGCTESSIEDNSIIETGVEEFYATIEGANARTYVDEQIRMRWHAEDRITIFKKETYNREFEFTGKTGANAGGFNQVSVDDEFFSSYKVDANYAVYPHSADTELDETDCFFTLNMPAEQTYAEKSFGLNANTMVAVSETGNLMFKNVGCYLRVRLYGENASISSVTLTTKGTEAIAGEAKVTPSMDGNPTCEMTGTGKSICLTCDTPVTISSNADAPTDFWIVVPPVTLASGFTVTIENSDGKTQAYDVNKSFTFERNKYYDMVREVEIENIPFIHVAQAGTLSSLISDEDKYTITSLKLSGELNGTDIKFIRENMAGCIIGYNTESYGALKILDLSDASIVEGGEAYYSSYTTENNVLGNSMFYGSATLESVILPKNITTIEKEAFRGCSNLISITIFENVKSIGNMAFYGSSLSEIDIPKGVETIGSGAFRFCNLSEITIPEGVKTIEYCAFSDNKNLKSVTIPQSVTSIGREAFGYHRGIDVYIKDLRKFLEACISEHKIFTSNYDEAYYRLFLNNVEVKDLIIPEGVTRIPVLATCSSLTSVTVSEGVDCSYYGAIFQSCINLKQVKFPNSCQVITPQTFLGSGLTTMTIGNNVTTIWFGAFSYCPLNAFYSYTQTPPAIDVATGVPDTTINNMPSEIRHSFGGVNKNNATLYVPAGCKTAYEASDWAKYFGTIVEMN